MTWNHKLATKPFQTLGLRGARQSEALQYFVGETAEEVKTGIERSHIEAEKIFQVAKELKGDPHLSTAYQQAVDLNYMLHQLYTLMTGHYSPARPARPAQGEPVGED